MRLSSESAQSVRTYIEDGTEPPTRQERLVVTAASIANILPLELATSYNFAGEVASQVGYGELERLIIEAQKRMVGEWLEDKIAQAMPAAFSEAIERIFEDEAKHRRRYAESARRKA